MDIEEKAIKDYLDAVDTVLNSNTFIFEFTIAGDFEESLYTYLKSESFINQLFDEDTSRGWFNLDYHKNRKSILNKNFVLEVTECDNGTEYLISFLTAENFYSFYNKQLSYEKAKSIVLNFTGFLTGVEYSAWKLYKIKPNFLKSDKEAKKAEASYFENFGNDAATVLAFENKGYLLLTNGMD